MTGRLSPLSAILVIARRDLTAMLFSRSFILFLLGPLFPVVIGTMAGGIGQRVQQSADTPELGIAMEAKDVDAMLAARKTLAGQLNGGLPEFRVIQRLAPGENFDTKAELAETRTVAILSGTPAQPQLTGTASIIEQWQGPVSMIAAQAQGDMPSAFPAVSLSATQANAVKDRHGQILTAQAAQTLLFLLTILLAGMVLSNLVEEKSNKIIEVLAAAVPMDAVFMGKLFAMLAFSFVAIVVWGVVGASFALIAGQSLPSLPEPAVGWPAFLALGILYFAMAYLLLGALLLSIGSMAATVREVQTLSMPVTFLQLLFFFLASYAVADPGSLTDAIALAVPFSSPFAMLAHAARDPGLWPHALALCWQVLWVALIIRGGARLFRSRVMKSGQAGGARPGRKGLLARLRPARPGPDFIRT